MFGVTSSTFAHCMKLVKIASLPKARQFIVERAAVAIENLSRNCILFPLHENTNGINKSKN
jgi:hypothetical protein